MTKANQRMVDETKLIINEESLRDKIYTIRGQKVMLDFDLAEIYGYTTKAFNRQVKNNLVKFEGELFMFRLTRKEVDDFVRCNFCTSREKLLFSGQGGGSRYLPYAFTEQGIYMLMTVLRGGLAIKQSRALIMTFKAMKDYILERQALIEQKEQLQSLKIAFENMKQIAILEKDLKNLEQKVGQIEKSTGKMITRNDLSPLLLDFHKAVEQKEFIFINGELMRASEVHMKIYAEAKKSICIIDNYVSIKTLWHLSKTKPGVKIVIFSDNLGHHLHKADYMDYKKERLNNEIQFIRTMGKVHDRFIIIDIGEKNETIYHCGASEKDAGGKMTVITRLDDVPVKEVMRGVVEGMMGNEALTIG